MRIARFLIVGAVTSGLLMTGIPASTADDEIDDFQLSDEEIAQYDEMIPDVTTDGAIPLDEPEAQEQLADALITANSLPGVTAADKLDIKNDLALIEAFNPTLAANTRAKMASMRSGDQLAVQKPNLLAAVPTLRLLNVNHQGQAYAWYCGPATASMILQYKGKKINQDSAANLLGTTKTAGTTWASKKMATGLNRALSSNTYQQIQSPSLAALKGAFVNSINAGYPLAVSTVEYAGKNTPHYNKHPNKTIGHWIVGRGQNNSGTTLMFMDPATSVWGKTYGTQATFSQTAASFHTFVRDHGIAW